MIEAVIGEVQATVLVHDLVDHALRVVELIHLQRGLLGEAKSLASAVRQIHQVTHIVVASSADTCVAEVELRHSAELAQDLG